LTWPGIASRQNYQNHENQIRKIMIIKAANQRKLQGCKLYDFGELFEKHPTRKIIDFESGRRALPILDFDDEQNRVRLTQPGGVHSGLRLDWLEFLQTTAFFVLLLLCLAGGVIAWWRF
jgi:hypothetical protein